MKKESKCFEVRTNDGKVIFSVYVYERGVVTVENPGESIEKEGEEKAEKMQIDNSQTDGNEMTAAQKRFLFRLMAGQGVEGEKAHEQLMDLFQVDSLKDVSKYEASKMIERLLDESKGGKDDRAPF
jgi:hypothetical protein